MTRMVIGAAMVKIEYFIHHTYYPELSSITWTLDYARESQLDESVGFWYIEEHPDTPGHTRVFYSVNVLLGNWVPGFETGSWQHHQTSLELSSGGSKIGEGKEDDGEG